jgi:hypothetical protein
MENSNIKMPTILRSKDVSEILGISSRTLFTYRQKRMISFTQVGRKLFYRHSDIEAFLNNNHMSTNSFNL